jgi:hypothetical protein
MVQTKIENKKFYAHCTHCGRWHEVNPRPGVTDCYFLNLESEFTCCDVKQKGRFAIEKDYEYFQG